MESQANQQEESKTAALPMTAALGVIRRVMMDRDLTPSERLAVIAVILQADGRTAQSWASYGGLVATFGIERGVIASALRSEGGKAIGKYLAVAGRGIRGATRYRILTGCLRLPEAVATSHQLPAATGCRKQIDRLPKATHSVVSSGKQQNPPTPPASGGDARGPRGRREKPEGDANSTIAAAVDAAYHEVVGCPMPRNWTRRIERMNGSAEALAGTTAADIRSAMKLAEVRRRDFGVGWLVQHMQAKLAKGRDAEAAKGRAREVAEAAAKSEAERADKTRRQIAVSREYFASLSEAERKAWRDKAAKACPYIKRADLVEFEAIRRAFQAARPAEGAT